MVTTRVNKMAVEVADIEVDMVADILGEGLSRMYFFFNFFSLSLIQMKDAGAQIFLIFPINVCVFSNID